MKAALPWANQLARARDRCSDTRPSVLLYAVYCYIGPCIDCNGNLYVLLDIDVNYLLNVIEHCRGGLLCIIYGWVIVKDYGASAIEWISLAVTHRYITSHVMYNVYKMVALCHSPVFVVAVILEFNFFYIRTLINVCRFINCLTHCGRVMSCGNLHLGQHWLR